MKPKQVLALAMIIAWFTTAAGARSRSLFIGDVIIRYDDALFRQSHRRPTPWVDATDGSQPTIAIFKCAERALCLDGTMLLVSVAPADQTGVTFQEERDAIPDYPRPTRPRPLWIDDPASFAGTLVAPRTFGGLDLIGTVSHSNCRAWTPSMMRAVGEYRGRRYTFATGWAYICGGQPGFSLEQFEVFLSGIAVVPPPTER